MATPLRCPKCGSSMSPVEHEGAQLDLCSGCKGLWFDRGELAKALHREAPQLGGPASMDLADAPSCPRCSAPLGERLLADDVAIAVDACRRCEGVFLQRGELDRIRRLSRKPQHITVDDRDCSGPITMTVTSAFSTFYSSAAELDSSHVGFFSGPWGYFSSADNSLRTGTAAGMKLHRRVDAFTMLFDGRVLIVGGLSAPTTDVAEIYQPGASVTAGAFSFLSRPGQPTCEQGNESSCVRTSVSRGAPDDSRIDGSATWLNGAVIVAGGNSGTIHSTELFVPAYACSQASPVDVRGNLIHAVDFCDIARTDMPTTDPSDPVPLP